MRTDRALTTKDGRVVRDGGRGTVSGAQTVARAFVAGADAGSELVSRARQKEVIARLGLLALELRDDVSAFMDEVVEITTKTLSSDCCRILRLLPDGERMLLEYGAGWKAGAVGRATVEATVNSHCGRVLHSRGPVAVPDLREERRFEVPELLRTCGAISDLSIAIRGPDGVLGVLGVHCRRQRNFQREELSFLSDVARLLGAAIGRQQAEEEAHRAARERAEAAERRNAFFSKASALLSICADRETALTTAAGLMVPAIADWCFVDVVGAEGQVSRLEMTRVGPDVSEQTLGASLLYRLDPGALHGTAKVLRTGRAELVEEVGGGVLSEVVFDQDQLEALRLLHSKSYMCLPLQVGGRIVGSLGLVSAGSGRRYKPDDVSFAEGLARCVAMALHNAQLHVSEVEMAREMVRLARRNEVQKVAGTGTIMSERETQILLLVARGMSNKQVGSSLYLTEGTVKRHLHNIYCKLGVASRAGAVRKALLEGWFTTDEITRESC